MTLTRFQDITRNFCITNGASDEFSRVWQNLLFIYKEMLTKNLKVELLKAWLQEAFMKYWKAGRNLAVDECMILLLAGASQL